MTVLAVHHNKLEELVAELSASLTNVKHEQEFMEVRERIHRASKSFRSPYTACQCPFYSSQRKHQLSRGDVVVLRSLHSSRHGVRSSLLSQTILRSPSSCIDPCLADATIPLKKISTVGLFSSVPQPALFYSLSRPVLLPWFLSFSSDGYDRLGMFPCTFSLFFRSLLLLRKIKPNRFALY